jgi:succinate dehydrogenase / fumarate reductase cytochrome b subunit
MNSFFLRHEFLIRRLHSLSGLIPIGAYMTVHLAVNSSLMLGTERFQSLVYSIHNFGAILPLIEWTFIFIPIIFHAVVGVWIANTGRTNSQMYGYGANIRYTWQRYTGYIALVFIFMHVFHLHGWFHADWWLRNVAEPLGMAQFRPYNAASTLATAMKGIVWPIFYSIGVLSCCYHLANGIWTAGITWGLWVSAAGQARALKGCAAFGLLLAALGTASLFAAKTTNPQQAQATEERMYEKGVEAGTVPDDPHKLSHPQTPEHASQETSATAIADALP